MDVKQQAALYVYQTNKGMRESLEGLGRAIAWAVEANAPDLADQMLSISKQMVAQQQNRLKDIRSKVDKPKSERG